LADKDILAKKLAESKSENELEGGGFDFSDETKSFFSGID
jgi:hypothetical protein